MFWFSKSSNYLSNHYRKSIYKANTIHSLVSFLHKNEYRIKENLLPNKLLEINYINLSSEKAVYIHNNDTLSNIIPSFTNTYYLDEKEFRNADFKILFKKIIGNSKFIVLDFSNIDFTLRICSKIKSFFNNLKVFIHYENKWKEYDLVNLEKGMRIFSLLTKNIR